MRLYTPIDIENFQKDLPYFIEITEWVRSFLGKPHPHLGRNGTVCPYVPTALNCNSIKLTVIRSQNQIPKQLEDIVKSYRDIFLDVEPREGEASLNKVILIIFPDLEADDAYIVDDIQQKLKPHFVDAGLMLGEFHKHNEAPGLHNPNFRPLRSPITMLAIRFMVESDLPFLQMKSDAPSLRIQYLQAYLRRFENSSKDKKSLNKALEALALAQAELATEKQEIENILYPVC